MYDSDEEESSRVSGNRFLRGKNTQSSINKSRSPNFSTEYDDAKLISESRKSPLTLSSIRQSDAASPRVSPRGSVKFSGSPKSRSPLLDEEHDFKADRNDARKTAYSNSKHGLDDADEGISTASKSRSDNARLKDHSENVDLGRTMSFTDAARFERKFEPQTSIPEEISERDEDSFRTGSSAGKRSPFMRDSPVQKSPRNLTPIDTGNRGTSKSPTTTPLATSKSSRDSGLDFDFLYDGGDKAVSKRSGSPGTGKKELRNADARMSPRPLFGRDDTIKLKEKNQTESRTNRHNLHTSYSDDFEDNDQVEDDEDDEIVIQRDQKITKPISSDKHIDSKKSPRIANNMEKDDYVKSSDRLRSKNDYDENQNESILRKSTNNYESVNASGSYSPKSSVRKSKNLRFEEDSDEDESSQVLRKKDSKRFDEDRSYNRSPDSSVYKPFADKHSTKTTSSFERDYSNRKVNENDRSINNTAENNKYQDNDSDVIKRKPKTKSDTDHVKSDQDLKKIRKKEETEDNNDDDDIFASRPTPAEKEKQARLKAKHDEDRIKEDSESLKQKTDILELISPPRSPSPTSVCEEVEEDPVEKMLKDRQKNREKQERRKENRPESAVNRQTTQNIYDVMDAQTMNDDKLQITQTSRPKKQKSISDKYKNVPPKVSTRLTLKQQSLNDLSRLGTPVDTSSSRSVREAIYEQWYVQKTVQLRANRQDKEKQEEEERIKSAKEKEEKENEKKLVFQAWSNSKKELDKERRSQKKKQADDEKEKNNEKDEQKKSAKLAYDVWNKQKSQVKRSENTQKIKSEQEKMNEEDEKKKEKIQNAVSAYNSWRAQKDENLKTMTKEKKTTSTSEKQQQEKDLQEKKILATQRYAEWEKKKADQKIMERHRSNSINLEEIRRPWRPSSSKLTSLKG